jgi:hypothetical protein
LEVKGNECKGGTITEMGLVSTDAVAEWSAWLRRTSLWSIVEQNYQE